MGQKINPVGFRLGIVRGWDSNWFGGKNFADKLVEDHKIRKYIDARIQKGGIAKVVIERTIKRITLTIHTARPGVVIGKGGTEVDKIKEELKKSGSRVQVELKFEHPGPWKSGGFGSPHWNAVTGVPRSRVRISPAPPLYPAVTHPDMAPRSRHFRKSPFPTRKWRERFSPRSTARFLCRCSLQIGDREGQRRLPRCSLRDVDGPGETRIEGHYVLCAGHFRAEGYGISRNRVAYPA